MASTGSDESGVEGTDTLANKATASDAVSHAPSDGAGRSG
jgi:hypothetical protein